MVRGMLGDECADKIDVIPLSNNTAERRIKDIAMEIKNELVYPLHVYDEYSLQLDESTDVPGLAVLLVFVRYALDKTFEEDLLLCECLQVTSRVEMFNTIYRYLKMHGIPWDK